MIWFWLLTLLLGINGSNGDCSRAGYEAKCSSVDEEQLYSFIADHGDVMTTLDVENSTIPHIELLKTNVYSYSPEDFLVSLTIKNSKVKSISQGAPGLGGYRYIKELDLSFNDIEDIDFLGHLGDLRKIVLHHNRIGFFGLWFRELQILDLSHNNIKNVTNIQQNERLVHLNLSHNMIEEISLNQFDDLISFQSLNLSHNNIHTVGYVPSTISAKKMLLESYGYVKLTIDLSFNKVVQMGNILEFDLGVDNTLKVISMENNQLASLDFLMKMNRTILHGDSLIIRDNKIKNLSPYNFDRYSLIKLDLSFNEIESIVPFTFEGLYTQEICLEHNKITQLNAAVFGGIANFYKLNLAYNPITTIEGSLTSVFPRQFSLDLSHCLLNKVPVGLNEQGFSEIYLNHNNIDSIEPNSFSSLKILDLSYNKLRNLQSGALSGLVIEGFLNLSHSSLSSLDGVFNNTKIQNLSLTGISLTKLSQKDLIGLRKVEYLDLSSTGISELSNNTFDQLPQLKNISLDDNSIQALPSNFFGYNENLISLSIIRNRLSTISSDSFPHKMRLKQLFLTIKGSILKRRFSNLIFLEELHFVHSQILELQKYSFIGLVSLKKLNFENSTVWKIEPGAFLGLPNLLDLDEQNLFANVAILKSKIFSGLIKLKNLNLSNIGINKIEDGTFFGLGSLTNLNLGSNKIRNLPENVFSGLNSLEMLDLSNNLIGSESLSVGIFSDLVDLTHLHLQHNKISVLADGVFSNLMNLQFLNLSHNQLGNLNEEVFYPLKKLNVLDINSNKVVSYHYEVLSESLSSLKTMGIGDNKWSCWNLVRMLSYFNKHSIVYNKISTLELEVENIEGIRCT